MLSSPLPRHRFQLRGFFCSIKGPEHLECHDKGCAASGTPASPYRAMNVQRFSHKPGLVPETTLLHWIVHPKGPSDKSSLGSPRRSDAFCSVQQSVGRDYLKVIILEIAVRALFALTNYPSAVVCSAVILSSEKLLNTWKNNGSGTPGRARWGFCTISQWQWHFWVPVCDMSSPGAVTPLSSAQPRIRHALMVPGAPPFTGCLGNSPVSFEKCTVIAE